MFGKNQNTLSASPKTGVKSKARKLLIGFGSLAVAGVLMGASPAMAHERVEVVRVPEPCVRVPIRVEIARHFEHHRHVIVERIVTPVVPCR
jgi:hypothetical protein